MDLQLQYFVPPTITAATAGYDPAIMKLGASLRGADSDKGAAIPNTPLTIRLNFMLNGAGIEFDYHGQLAYVNFCCFEKHYSREVFMIVERWYKKYLIGIPKKPTQAKWIHLIPLHGPMPDLQHSLLSQQLTVSFYWAVFGQLMAQKGKV